MGGVGIGEVWGCWGVVFERSCVVGRCFSMWVYCLCLIKRVCVLRMMLKLRDISDCCMDLVVGR